VHVQTAYHRHRDLLELLKHFSDAHINERLCRGGPPIHMSSFGSQRSAGYTPDDIADSPPRRMRLAMVR